MQLNKESQQAWETLVPSLFEQSKKNGGETKLSQEFVVQYDKDGETKTIVCRAGAKVFFPSKRSPMSSTLSKDRSTACCMIYCDDVHVTLTLKYRRIGTVLEKAGVELSFTRIKHHTLV